MSFRDFARSFKPGNDAELARTQYAGRESASDEGSRKRRERHRARVVRDGDSNSDRLPRRARKNKDGACG
jgi:hypothetical protein